ncbi:MAG: hypothetical protein R2690_08935 [Acidimicrobiales bacterium]
MSLVRKLSEAAEERVPELELSVVEKLPTAQEILDQHFAFAQQLVKNQQEFANAVIEAAKPVTEKAGVTPKTTVKSTAKKAKTAAAA